MGFALETPLEWLVVFLRDAFFGEGVFGDGAIAMVGGGFVYCNEGFYL